MCKGLKFDHTIKKLTHKPESILEYETQKIFWDFEVQTDHLHPTRRQDLVLITKQKRRERERILLFRPTKIKENENINKYLNFFQRTKNKLWNMRVTEIPIIIGALGMVSKGLKKDRRNRKSEEKSRPSRLQQC